MSIQNALVDLDGVLVDFFYPALKAHNAPLDLYLNWPKEEWDIAKVLGISQSEFWEKIDTEEFWTNLKFTPEAETVLKELDFYKPLGLKVCLLTSPSQKSAGWKQAWIQKHLPDYAKANRYLIGSPKEFCANSKAVLIDDSDTNCEKFKACGGKTILVPRPWNQNHALAGSTAKYVATQLGLAMGSFARNEGGVCATESRA